MHDYLNPWLRVPSEPPYFLPCDLDIIRAYNAKHPTGKYRLQSRVLPEPFMGRMTAPVVLLNLNPGFDGRNIEEHRCSRFKALIRKNYSQTRSGYPFYYLDPTFETLGRQWWEKKLRHLLKVFGPKQLARSILCIEYFPYHSRGFGHASLELPSQEYGFCLVGLAIARQAVVVIMRARNLWTKRIPELKRYPRKCTLNSPQNPALSPGNCTRFDEVVSAIRDGNVDR